jgi:hypothetical protein
MMMMMANLLVILMTARDTSTVDRVAACGIVMWSGLVNFANPLSNECGQIQVNSQVEPHSAQR